MDPGINPSWPSLAGVAPLRVTHRSRSTASPVRGSCHPHTSVAALLCRLSGLCQQHQTRSPTRSCLDIDLLLGAYVWTQGTCKVCMQQQALQRMCGSGVASSYSGRALVPAGV